MWHPTSNNSNSLPSQEQPSVLAQIRKTWETLIKNILLGDSPVSIATIQTEEAMAVNGVNGSAIQPTSPVKLDVIVVGAGISGLATAISSALSGHNVTVFESAKELLEVRRLPSPADMPSRCFKTDKLTNLPIR